MSLRDSEYVELDLRIVHMTSGALLLSDDNGVEEWVPRVGIEDGETFTWDDLEDTRTISMTRYYAEEKGFV
ncbi:MAG: hypothetical protein ACXADW_14115 [Candidatus Hodarchaeales archaeon]|jgi:hypothetical protein